MKLYPSIFKDNINMFFKSKDFISMEYVFEVIMTDIFCLYYKINPSLILITPKSGDGGIDSIIVDTTNEIIFALQITLTDKNKKQLDSLDSFEIFSHDLYNLVLNKYPKFSTQKIVISRKNNKHYKSSLYKIDFISDEDFYNIFFTTLIKYDLLTSDLKLNTEYINNVYSRTSSWLNIYRITPLNIDLLKSLIYFNVFNLKHIKENDFFFFDNLNYYNDILFSELQILFNKVSNPSYLKNLPSTVFKIMTKTSNYIEDRNLDFHLTLAKFLVDLIDIELNNFPLKIEVTKYYYSLYYKNNCIAYFTYDYYKSKNKKACFSFKCIYEYIQKDTLFYELIKDKKIISTKVLNNEARGLNHNGMLTSLRYPDLKKDKAYILRLINLSIEYINKT